MIDIENVSKIYQLGESEVRALDGVSIRIEKGEMAAIMGPSGSGKSTLMAILGCLDVPTSGVYRLDGDNVESLSDDQLADVRNRKIGFVFQQFNLLARTTALDNVMLPLTYGGLRGRARVNDPAIVLADEPTGALDSKTGAEIIGLFQRLHRDFGQTVLYVTHDPFIARHTRRVIRLSDGNVVGDERIEHPLAAGTPRPSEVALAE